MLVSRELSLQGTETMKATVTIDRTVKRGPESWSFIYITLGFVLTIEGTVVAMLDLPLPWNLLTYAAVSVLTFRLWISSRWFQSKLIGWKNDYESRER